MIYEAGEQPLCVCVYVWAAHQSGAGKYANRLPIEYEIIINANLMHD